MNSEKIFQLESLLGRKLTAEEIEKFRTIKDILGLSDNDALWDILIAMEYQRDYYEKIPGRIQQLTENICQNIKGLAEQEAAKAQNQLVDSVIEQSQKLSMRLNYIHLIIWGTVLITVCLLSGAALMWAGYSIGSGQTHPPAIMLRMPVGFIIGGLSLGSGIFLLTLCTKDFSEGRKSWKKRLITVALLIIPGIFFISMTI